MNLLAFDLFGTLFNMEDVPLEERSYYGSQIHDNLDPEQEWEPINLPTDWAYIPPYPDARRALQRLRKRGVYVVTFSNAPAWLTIEMLRNARIEVDGITPLELFKMTKPNPEIYRQVELWGFPCDECGMVTANESFGDLEGAKGCGMKPILVRGEEYPTLHHLADSMGA